ncbi:sperm acrosome-associated protein 7-like [Hylobates moloch]|uniref:sperm acrosome-associated protein 7-like n=1 Tax=Hylobates moloch TaxID=81572 RepID=UPI0026769752|nr:sperm acrosome-associated protein 7-like [Hylobates moloch]
MAVSQGDGTLCFVLLLCCWQEVKTWPIRMNSDEILVQEILDLNKTTLTKMPSTASTLSTTIRVHLKQKRKLHESVLRASYHRGMPRPG